MRKALLRGALLLAIVLIVSFVVVMVNQTAQLVAFADRFHPLAGDALFWSLLALYAFCLAVPLYLFLRLPRALVPPSDTESPAYARHLERLRKRLQRNPLVPGGTLDGEEGEEGLTEAIEVLDARADELTRAAGAQVFLTTAVSQNGSLDSVIVLAAQSKLVYEIAQAYYQRPTLRDLTYLYGNVAATALITGELEDLDLSEQIQPILSSIVGSAAGAVPGFQAASTLFVSSVTTGAANTLLTLRVGLVTKQYCRALVAPERRAVRRSAMLQATAMLGGIVLDGGRKVWQAMVTASGRRISGMFTGAADAVRSAGASVTGRAPFTRGAPGTAESGEA